MIRTRIRTTDGPVHPYFDFFFHHLLTSTHKIGSILWLIRTIYTHTTNSNFLDTLFIAEDGMCDAAVANLDLPCPTFHA